MGVRCNGCGADIGPGDWPRLSGQRRAAENPGSALRLRPGEGFDLCGLCSVAAFTTLEQLAPLIARMRQEGLGSAAGTAALTQYLRSLPPAGPQLSVAANGCDAEPVPADRFGAGGRRVAQIALSLSGHHQAPGSSHG